MSEKVAGFCPMGCGQTLFLGRGGYVTCSLDICPDPTAVSTLLDNRETQHLVRIVDGKFTIQHPLRERVPSNQARCSLKTKLLDYLDHVGPMLRTDGYFRAYESHAKPGEWIMTSVPDPVRVVG